MLATPREMISCNICPASAIKAKLLLTIPPMISTKKKIKVMTNAKYILLLALLSEPNPEE